MNDLGYFLFGMVDGLVLLGVLTALMWAAVHDGRDERAFRLSGWSPAPVLAVSPV